MHYRTTIILLDSALKSVTLPNGARKTKDKRTSAGKNIIRLEKGKRGLADVFWKDTEPHRMK